MIKGVINILKGTSAITDLTTADRIYPQKRHQEEIPLPAIMVSRTGRDSTDLKDKVSVGVKVNFELHVFANNYAEAEKLGDLCKGALDNFIGAMSGYNFDRILIRDESDTYDMELPYDSVFQLYEAQMADESSGPNYPPGVSDPVTVRNSSGSLNESVAAGGSLLLDDITITQMNGLESTHPAAEDVEIPFGIIYVVNTDEDIIQTLVAWPVGNRIILANMDIMLPDGSSIDQPITDEVTVPLIAPSYTSDGVEVIAAPVAWPSGGVQELGVVEHTDSTGATVEKKWGEAFVATPGVSASGVMYMCLIFTQNTSYRTGDEGWYLQNGNGEVIPTNPAKIMRLDYSKAEPFDTVSPANTFGLFNRFCLTTGVAAARLVTPFNNIVIDTATGWMYMVERQSLATWNAAVDACEAGTWGGVSDWRLPSRRHIESLQNYERTYVDEPPGFPNSGLANIWTSTTEEQNSANAYTTFSGGNYRFALTGKTNTRQFIACRPWFAQS